MCAYEQNIVIDLEFNPTPRKVGRGLRFEIIEIGAVKLDAQGNAKGSSAAWSNRSTRGSSEKTSSLLRASKPAMSAKPLCSKRLSHRSHGGSATRLRASWPGAKMTSAKSKGECAHKSIEVPPQLRRWLDLQAVYPRVMNVGNGRRMKCPPQQTGTARSSIKAAPTARSTMRKLLPNCYVSFSPAPTNSKKSPSTPPWRTVRNRARACPPASATHARALPP